MARQAGHLRPLAGTAFLLQVAEKFWDEDLRDFVCPEDPERPREVRRDALYCSYRGPDLETARRFVEGTLPEDTIIACDACGPRGDVPHHEDALVILRASGRVEVLPRGQPGGAPATIGPDSPDPRFRHLVR
jgi:hypothetical protein